MQVATLGSATTLYFHFNSFDSTGALAALSNATGAVRVNGSNSYVTSGSTISISCGGNAGDNLVSTFVDNGTLALAANDFCSVWLSHASVDVFDMSNTHLGDFLALGPGLTTAEILSVNRLLLPVRGHFGPYLGRRFGHPPVAHSFLQGRN